MCLCSITIFISKNKFNLNWFRLAYAYAPSSRMSPSSQNGSFIVYSDCSLYNSRELNKDKFAELHTIQIAQSI